MLSPLGLSVTILSQRPPETMSTEDLSVAQRHR